MHLFRHFFLPSVLLLSMLMAQEQGAPAPAPNPGSGGGGAPGGDTTGGALGGNTRQPGGTTGLPNPNDSRRQPNDNRQQFPEMQPQPIFLSGKVVMADGTPPPEPVTIERVCNSGSPRPEGYTDSKGRFSFALGQNQGMFNDASMGSNERDPFATGGFGGANRNVGGGMGGMGGGSSRQMLERELMGCELHAKLPGHRAQPVQLAGRRSLDNPDVGTIILHRLSNVEGLTTSMTTMTAPKDARKAYDKGRDLMKKNKLAEAQKELDKAVTLHPKFAAAWYELGRIRASANQGPEAREAFMKAIEADAKYVHPYLPLANMAVAQQKWDEAAGFSGKLIKLNPADYPVAFLLNGIANYNLKKYEEAEKSATEAVKLDPQHRLPKAHHLLGALLAEKGAFAPAAAQLRDYLKFAPAAGDADNVKKMLGEIEARMGQGGAAKAQ